MSQMKRFQAGLDFCAVSDIRSCINGAADAGYFFICAPIVHPRYDREFISGEAKFREEPLTRADIVTYNMAEWSNWVVGKISEGLNVDSEDPIVQIQSEEALNQELMQASHLGLSAIQIQLHGLQHNDLARIIYSKMVSSGENIGCTYQIWVNIPMQNPAVMSSSYIEGSDDEAEQEDTWSWWNKFRTLCNFEDKLGLALEMSADLPSDDEIARWAGEPIRCLVIPTTLFLRNKKNYPVLSKGHQAVYRELMKNLNMQIVIKGAVRHEQVKFYQQYLEYLSKTLDDPVSEYARGYEDFLQCPLQPLMDNLESSTYEVFERDPIKYRLYKEAIYQALRDRIPDKDRNTTVFVVMIVGAGRGPLVRATMLAANKANRKVKIYAVDKNPGAIITLKSQQLEIWGDLVTVVSTDMREWNPPEMADILVSELLGSFGDNELSPECLDGAQKFLKEGGISIPSSYTSYVCPIQSARLWAETRKGRLMDKFHLHYLETAYVVHQQNKFNLADIQPLFTFRHPNTDAVPNNRRRKILSFKVRENAVLHGVSGFFDAVLYKDVLLSIHPDTHSQHMCSWFPIFFPIHTPIPVKKGDDLELIFWRCVNSKKVWYEWCFTKPTATEIHNPGGRSYSIGL